MGPGRVEVREGHPTAVEEVMDEQNFCEMLRRANRPGYAHMRLAFAQITYESHGGVGPCPCWTCETLRSYLASRGLPTYGPR